MAAFGSVPCGCVGSFESRWHLGPGAGGEGAWPMAARTMAASVCLFVCVSVTRLREPRLPCIADARVLLVQQGCWLKNGKGRAGGAALKLGGRKEEAARQAQTARKKPRSALMHSQLPPRTPHGVGDSACEARQDRRGWGVCGALSIYAGPGGSAGVSRGAERGLPALMRAPHSACAGGQTFERFAATACGV